MRIVLCYPAEEKHIEQIRAAAPWAEVVDARQERIAEELHIADIYCGHAKVPVDWPAIVKEKRLQWIQSSAAGMDHCLTPEVIASEITVTSASGVLSDQVTEHAIALLTGFTRSMPVFHAAQQKREFIRRPTRDLTRATVGIVGLGGVGRRLARVLSAFDCRILATDRFPIDKPDYVETLLPADRLSEIVPEVDFLFLSAPLNDETRGMIDASVLQQMKPTAVLANLARGPLVVTDDLIDVLRTHRIAGAVMDVTDPEPLPADHPLWEQDNVIITPHVAGQSAWRIDRMTEMFCENLQRFRKGKPLINYLVDKSLGFPIRDGQTPLWVEE